MLEAIATVLEKTLNAYLTIRTPDARRRKFGRQVLGKYSEVL